MKQVTRWMLYLVGLAALTCTLTACQQNGDGYTDNNDDEGESDSERTPLSDASSFADAALCSDSDPPLIVDFAVYQTPDLAEPSPRTPFRDPVFGTCLLRVTDRQADPAPGDITGLKNEYSRVQAFNADGTLLIAYGTEGNWYLYDVGSLQPLGQLPVEVEPRWDATNPDLLYYTDETRLMSFDVRSGERRIVHEFADDFPGQRVTAVWTCYEGSPSFDGRYWGLMAEDEDWLAVAFLVYNLQTDQVIATRTLPDRPEVDNVTISPLGNYFLASYDDYCEPGTLGDDAHPCGLMVYDRSLENGRSLVRIIGHTDVAVDADGREVLIYQEIDTDHIAMLDLATGTVTELFPIDFSHSPIGLHFSGRAARLPGWALISTYSGGYPQDATWMDDAVFAVELKAGGRVVRLAHTHSLVDENQEHDYWAEPHASVNRDFTRVVFTSNWGRSGTDEVDMYMIILPPDWVESLPGG